MGGRRPSQFIESFNSHELEILCLIRNGLSNKEIARKLFLSLETIKWYNRQIFEKLGVRSRTQAIEKASQSGLLERTKGDSNGEAKLYAHNIPAPVNTFIGRAKEQKEVIALLRSPDSRLVTVYGPGGIGKTRLALETARKVLPDFPHGVWLVDLSLITDSIQVPQLVAESLGLHRDGKRHSEDLLVHYLSSRSLLLILDNCEHLVDACVFLIALLMRHCPYLKVLVTSRETLGIEGEALYPIFPLPFPDPRRPHEVKTLKRFEAVQLFIERSRSVCPGFEVNPENASDIALVCQRLDGIPLALELAAVRTNVLSPGQIAARLDDCFRLLAGRGHAILPRHQTMRTVLDWSYSLLSPMEQVMLRRLAVFTGGWTLEAAEQVCMEENCSGEKKIDVLDLLSCLVNKSMVIASIVDAAPLAGKIQQHARYRLLEPIRQYAQEKLKQAGEMEALCDRHLDYFLNLAEQTCLRPFQNKWPCQWKQVKPDQDNLRTALRWAFIGDYSKRIEKGLKLVAALSDYWNQVGQNQEGLAWLSKALALTADRGPSYHPLRAIFFMASGQLAGLNTNYWEAKQLLDESVALFRAYGDDWHLARALSSLALWSYPVDQWGAYQAVDESIAIARRVGDPIILALSLFFRGDMNSKLGNPAAGCQDGKESLKLLLDIGERGGACFPFALLAQCAIQQGDVVTAFQYRQEYIKHRSEIEDLSLEYYASGFLLHTSYHQGKMKEVETIAQNLLDQSVGKTHGAKDYALRNLGIVYKCQGNYKRAATCYFESISGAKEENDSFGILACMSGLAGIVAHLGQPYRAARLFGAVEELLKTNQRTFAWGPERDELEKETAALHEMLSAEDFSRADTEGRSMKFEEAFQEACLIVEELSQ